MKKDTRAGSGLTVGVDLGDRWSRCCVLDQQGQILEEDTIATTARALRKRFSDLKASRVVIEVGTHSPWVQRLLQELGHETITAHTQSVRLIYGSRDKNAWFIPPDPLGMLVSNSPITDHLLQLLLKVNKRWLGMFCAWMGLRKAPLFEVDVVDDVGAIRCKEDASPGVPWQVVKAVALDE